MSKTEIEPLAARWLAGWNIGAGPFDGAIFRDIFAPGEAAISVFDNVAGDVIVLTSVDDYIATWTPFMAPMAHWSVRLEALDIRAGVDLAVSTFRIIGTDTRGADGAPVPFGQYGTHVWQKLPGLGWRIVHEHLTAFDTTKAAG